MLVLLPVSDADWKEGQDFLFDILYTFANPTDKEWDCLNDTSNLGNKTCGRIWRGVTGDKNQFIMSYGWNISQITITSEL